MTPTQRAGRAILMYHAISGAPGDARDADARYTITRAALAEQLRALRTRVGVARAVRDVLRAATPVPTNSPPLRNTGAIPPHVDGKSEPALALPGTPKALDPGFRRDDAQWGGGRDDARRGGLDHARQHESADADGSAVCITFDDGHVTNYSVALPVLLEHGATADFFVNPARVGEPGFATWAQLREMADAGMSIQSHGDDHAYFTALSPNALERQLRRSKAEIEDRIGQPCTLLAPPGGRMPPLLASLACALGYEAIACSVPGRWLDPGAIVLPRHAVTDATRVEDVVGWALGEARATRGPAIRHAVLGAAKRALGDARYERLRARLLSRRTAPAPAEGPVA